MYIWIAKKYDTFTHRGGLPNSISPDIFYGYIYIHIYIYIYTYTDVPIYTSKLSLQVFVSFVCDVHRYIYIYI